MKFSIHVIRSDTKATYYEIVLGSHKESYPLVTTLWAAEDYEKQWRNSLIALVEGRVKKCVLITDIQPETDSVGVTFWALFRIRDSVIFQERFFRLNSADLSGPPEMAIEFIAPRIDGPPEYGDCQVSEWELSIGSIEAFLEKSQSEK